MQVKFLWGDCKIEYGPLSLNHVNLVQRMGGVHPENYISGVYDFDTGEFSSILRYGTYPSPEEVRFMLEWDFSKYDEKDPPKRYSATVEDTEPEFNLSFLDDPHAELYPPAFDGDKMRGDAKERIKNHVLDTLSRGGFDNANEWIYFTLFGSGASYNWDEDGDFDVQMWVDIDKYNDSHKVPMVSDDLIKAVRTIVQTVNFPSFADLNLDNGKMLIQYYPQPGKGSRDENEAKKPYACYDMETDEWIVKPRPYSADFYGTHFLSIQTKAGDIAEQAETVLDELQRNVLSFQFWSSMYSKYNTTEYQEAAEDAQDKAMLNKEAIANLFEGVFGGRQEAYSPEGKGIDDERDAIQKLLEVWGIFQKLKHYARAPLPWDEQEMPKAPEEEKKESLWKEAFHLSQMPGTTAWGYVNGHLIIAPAHHQGIMMALINNGWTWDQLLSAKQAWGWAYKRASDQSIVISFASDSGFQTAAHEVKAAWESYFPGVKITTGNPSLAQGVKNTDQYGEGLHGFDNTKYWETDEGKSYLKNMALTPIPSPPGNELPPPAFIPGGGTPPPRKLESYNVEFTTDTGAQSQVVLTAKSPEEAMEKAKNYFAAQGDHITPTNAKLSAMKKTTYSLKTMSSGSFGYINGHLILGQSHHQAIMAELLKKGWTWEDLMNAQQAWGWWGRVKDWETGDGTTTKQVDVRFSSDAGTQSKEIFTDCLQSFEEIFGVPARDEHDTKSIEDTGKEYGQGLAGKNNIDYYINNKGDMAGLADETPIPPPPSQDKNTDQGEQLNLFDHPAPGGGMPPPKKNQQLDLEILPAGTKVIVHGYPGIIANGPDSDGDYWVEPEGSSPENGQGEYVHYSDIELAPHYTPEPTEIEGPKIGDKFITSKGTIHTVTHNDHGSIGASLVHDPTQHEYMPGPQGNWPIEQYQGWIDKGVLKPYQEAKPTVPEGNYNNLNLSSLQKFVDEMNALGTSVPMQVSSVSNYLDEFNLHSDDKSQILKHYFGENYDQVQQGLAPTPNPGGGMPPPKKIGNFKKTADWGDLMDKAQRLRQDNQVQITVNEPDHVVGTVQGDHGTYQTEIWRDDPSSQAITMWDCECPWSQYSWGRTRQWKKYEGRPCAHTLALFWQAQANPPADTQAPAPEQAPPVPAPGGQMIPQQGLVSPVPIPNVTLPVTPNNAPGQGVPPPGGFVQPQQSAPAPNPAYSQPTTPQTAQGVINIPGALSHVKTAAFENGQHVRCKNDVVGEDTVTDHEYLVPQNSAGTVLYSDNVETVVIFPLSGSYHSPHLVKVEGLTYEFYADESVNPFIKRRRSGASNKLSYTANR